MACFHPMNATLTYLNIINFSNKMSKLKQLEVFALTFYVLVMSPCLSSKVLCVISAVKNRILKISHRDSRTTERSLAFNVSACDLSTGYHEMFCAEHLFFSNS